VQRLAKKGFELAMTRSKKDRCVDTKPTYWKHPVYGEKQEWKKTSSRSGSQP
jgi:hypothetical protein